MGCGERSVCWSGLSPDGTFGEPVLLTASKEILEDWTFSPDGRYVLYRVSRSEPSTGIYVQPFPGPGRRQQISAEGIDPVWRHDGKEILFWDDGAIWSVAVSGSAGALSFGQPQKLFGGTRRSGSSVALSRGLAVSADGSRIFWVQGADQPDDGVINVMFGFFDNK